MSTPAERGASCTTHFTPFYYDTSSGGGLCSYSYIGSPTTARKKQWRRIPFDENLCTTKSIGTAMSVTTNVSEELFFYYPGNVWRSRGLDHVSNGKGLNHGRRANCKMWRRCFKGSSHYSVENVCVSTVPAWNRPCCFVRSDGIALRNEGPCFSEAESCV